MKRLATAVLGAAAVIAACNPIPPPPTSIPPREWRRPTNTLPLPTTEPTVVCQALDCMVDG